MTHVPHHTHQKHTNSCVGDEPDAETRRNALLALVELSQTLGVHPNSPDGPNGAANDHEHGGLTRAQLLKALATLLRSTGDYATDKRGDVGSWCRQAALRGLAALLALLPPPPAKGKGRTAAPAPAGAVLRVGGAVCAGGYGRGTLADLRCEGRVACVRFHAGQPGAFFFPYQQGTGLFPAAAVAPCGDDDAAAAISSSPASPPAIGSEAEAADAKAEPLIDSPTFTRIVAAALQQLCEKLDVVRECAGAVLLDLLALPTPPLPALPDRPLLEAALLPPSSSSDPPPPPAPAPAAERAAFYKAGNPAVVFPRVVQLLGSGDSYHRAVVAGMVISIGGLTESVVRASLGAAVEWAQAQRRGEGNGAGIARVGRTVLELLDAHAGEDRVVLPALRTADLFVQKGVWLEGDLFGPGTGEEGGHGESSLARGLLARVRRELHGCKDVKKLLACLSVAVHLLEPLPASSGDNSPSIDASDASDNGDGGAMRLLMVLLGHRFPRVRKACAELLYTRLLLHGDQLLPPLPAAHADAPGENARQDAVLECLAATCWDTGELAGVREARDRLCRLMGITPPAPVAGGLSGSGSGAGRGRVKEDELASYAALVKEMGY